MSETPQENLQESKQVVPAPEASLEAPSSETKPEKVEESIQENPEVEPSGVDQDHLYIAEEKVEIVEPEPALPAATFDSLTPELQEVCKGQGWSDLTLVQKKTIPYMREGRDMMILSKTGSGKTGAFLIPLLEVIEPTHFHPQALILAPTRELALQIEDESKKLGGPMGLKTVALYGGVKYQKQIDALKSGVHLVIATPGRLIDHLQRQNLDFNDLRDLILDEADEMLSMGFYDDMKKILRYLPEQYCTTLFSATIPQQVKSLSKELQAPNRGFLSLKVHTSQEQTLDHYYTVVDALEKDKAILRILEVENPESSILFCNMKRDVQYLYDFLKPKGFNVGVLSGDVSQAQRQKTLKAFREKKLKVLIATDVAARGIDISHVTHVFLHDHPEDNEVYIHRAGRTARAGRKGKAISVVSPLEELDLQKTSKIYDIAFNKIPLPTEEEIFEQKKKQIAAALEEEVRALKPVEKKMVQALDALTQQMASDDHYRSTLNLLLYRFYKEQLGQ